MFSVSCSTEGNLLTTSFATLYDQNPITRVSFSTYFDVLDSIFVVFLLKLIKGMDPKTTSSQVLIRVLAKKPGWKDTNFQVQS